MSQKTVQNQILPKLSPIIYKLETSVYMYLHVIQNILDLGIYTNLEIAPKRLKNMWIFVLFQLHPMTIENSGPFLELISWCQLVWVTNEGRGIFPYPHGLSTVIWTNHKSFSKCLLRKNWWKTTWVKSKMDKIVHHLI